MSQKLTTHKGTTGPELIDKAPTVDPALAAAAPPSGANPHYADRPQLDPLAAARPEQSNEASVVAAAEEETRRRLDAQSERERLEREARETHEEAAARRNADAPNILTVSEFRKLNNDEQNKFRQNNGTVCEDSAKAKKALNDTK